MTYRKPTVFLSAALLVLVTACNKPPEVEKKTETTSRGSEGTAKTTTESTQTGATSESKTEVKNPGNLTASMTKETVEGTVKEFTPGKHLTVLTGESKTHHYSLDDKDVSYSVDSSVAIGKHVTVVDEKDKDNKNRRVTVKTSS
jgi:hypothetical protein